MTVAPAPIAVFVYNRYEHFVKTIKALSCNYLAPISELYVVSDCWYDISHKEDVLKVRKYAEGIIGFKSVHLIFRKTNMGAFESFYDAQKTILNNHEKLIVMEDDIVTSPNYLDFINQGLEFYKDYTEVYSVTGYCHPGIVPDNYPFDYWVSPFNFSWGYGFWKDRDRELDLRYNPYNVIRSDSKLWAQFKEYGGFVLESLLGDHLGLSQMADARICAHMLIKRMVAIAPKISKVKNIGCDGSGLHARKLTKFDGPLDPGINRRFHFDRDLSFNDDVVRRYLRFMSGNIVKRSFRNCGVLALRDYLRWFYKRLTAC